MEIQTDCTYEEKEYTIIEIAKSMKEDKTITIEYYYMVDSTSTKEEPEDFTTLKGIVVSVNQYSKYKFLIGESCKIEGVTTGKLPEIIEYYKKVEEFEKELFGKEPNINDDNKEDDKEKEETIDIPSVGDNIDTSNPIEITTYMAIKSNSKNILNLTGVENVNYAIQEKTNNVDLSENILTANNSADSNDSCKIQISGTYSGQSYINNLIVYVEPKNTTTIDGDNYYRIYTTQDLVRLAELTNHNLGSIKNAIMMNDINLDGIDWEPMGYYEGENEIASFKGIFNGQNYTIKNMRINSFGTEKIGVGFIGVLNEGTIKNLKFDNPDVYSERIDTSIVVGYSYNISTIENVKVLNGKIETKNAIAGGICGTNFSNSTSQNKFTIRNCSNNATITSNTIQVGGIIGMINDGIVENCYNTGTVTGGGSALAGISAITVNSQISSCYNIGEIIQNGNGANVGGIVGLNRGKVEYCYNLGNVLNNGNLKYIGGIVGLSDTKDISFVENCYNKANITSNGIIVGGIVGYNADYCKINNCYISNLSQVKYGTILATSQWGSKTNYIGKIVGYLANQTYVTNVASINDADMPTVYDVLNKFSENMSIVWSNSNLNQPNLLWEK